MIKIVMAAEPTAVGSLPIEPSFALSGEIKYRRTVFPTFGGDSISKSLATDPDETYELNWTNISQTEKTTLLAFVDAHLGPLESFIWQAARWHFLDDSLTLRIINPDIYEMAISVEKIPDLCPVTKPTGGP